MISARGFIKPAAVSPCPMRVQLCMLSGQEAFQGEGLARISSGAGEHASEYPLRSLSYDPALQLC
jgi:hypothetical protein